MAQGTLKIHTENLLPIIKKWLYSDKEIFLRELISNACDALSKLKILAAEGVCSLGDTPLQIEVVIDKENKTLTVRDTGIGMTAEEVEKYIAQLAFSGAEEFAQKYKNATAEDPIIGHFGLGFYSSYMVAKLVEIKTLSYQEVGQTQAGTHWSCDGSASYEITPLPRTTRGTEVILHIDSESEEFLEDYTVREVLKKYCSFLPYPILLEEEAINEKEPLWTKPSSECTDEEFLTFYRNLYPLELDPIFWVHLNVDYPFNLKGILYFPKITKKFDWSKNALQLYCNRVFVSDNCQDVFAQHLTILRGAIDSPDIPLNVSRSYLQMDRTVKQLSSHISKKIADKLNSFYQKDPDAFLKAYPDLELFMKLASLQDEKFYDRVKHLLFWKTTDGNWITLDDYLARHKEQTKNKIFYTQDEKGQAHLLDLYASKNIEILVSNMQLDNMVMNYLETKYKGDAPIKFQRIDGALDEAILSTNSDTPSSTASADNETQEGSSSPESPLVTFCKEVLKRALPKEQLFKEELPFALTEKALTSSTIPAMFIVEEDSRRMADLFAITQPDRIAPLHKKETFVINTNSALVQSLKEMQNSNLPLAEDLFTHIYELSILSQKGLKPEEITPFLKRAHRLMQEVASSHTS